MSDVEQAVERLRFEIHPVRAGNPRHKADIRTVLDALEAAEQERDRLRVKAEKWDKLPDFHLAEIVGLLERWMDTTPGKHRLAEDTQAFLESWRAARAALGERE